MIDDLELDARLAAQGDIEALDRVLVASRPMVMARCRRVLPNPHDAEEAAQEALLQVSLHIHRFEGRSRFSTWLYRLATNAAIDTYRSLKRRQSVSGAVPEQAHSGSSPSVIVGARIDLLEAIEQVDHRIAEAVLLRDLCELDYAEISSVLDVPLGTTKRRIHDGRDQLRRILREIADAAT